MTIRLHKSSLCSLKTTSPLRPSDTPLPGDTDTAHSGSESQASQLLPFPGERHGVETTRDPRGGARSGARLNPFTFRFLQLGVQVCVRTGGDHTPHTGLPSAAAVPGQREHRGSWGWEAQPRSVHFHSLSVASEARESSEPAVTFSTSHE